MAVNKVTYGGSTLIDLTGDSVTPETLANGVTAHDKSGAKITGTMVGVNCKIYHVNVPTAVAAQFVTVVSGDPDVAAHYADDSALVTVRKMTNNTTQGTAMIAQGNHSFGTAYGAYVNRKNDGTHGYNFLTYPLTTDKTDGSVPFVKCSADGNIVVWAQRLQNNFGGADYIITFSR